MSTRRHADPSRSRPHGGYLAEVPTLRPGIDAVPTVCTQCGSHIIETNPDIDGYRFGDSVCVMCGTLLCEWARRTRL